MPPFSLTDPITDLVCTPVCVCPSRTIFEHINGRVKKNKIWVYVPKRRSNRVPIFASKDQKSSWWDVNTLENDAELTQIGLRFDLIHSEQLGQAALTPGTSKVGGG